MKSLAIALVLFCHCHLINAQTLDSRLDGLEWRITGLYDVNYDTLMGYQASFVTEGDKIRWIQQNGAFVQDFKIQVSEGSWQDVKTDGRVQYTGKLDGVTGTITFERKEDKITIRASFMDDGVDLYPFVFHVSSVNKKI